MVDATVDPWDTLTGLIADCRRSIRSTRARHVNSPTKRSLAKQVVQHYFRQTRPGLLRLGLDLGQMDELMQELLQLANGRNRKESYQRCLAKLVRLGGELEGQREIRLGEGLARAQQSDTRLSYVEERILATLQGLAPTIALSYQKVLADLASPVQLSFRGTAAELREVLRDVLDSLAPDEIVSGEQGFQLEEGQSKPTMKQKVRFILKSRGLPRSATKAPEDSVSLVEERTAALARSTYNRGSLATHVATTRTEVIQLKMYVDGVLAELLEIHAAIN